MLQEKPAVSGLTKQKNHDHNIYGLRATGYGLRATGYGLRLG